MGGDGIGASNLTFEKGVEFYITLVGPLISAIGGTITQYFMRNSFYWEDCILLAILPIGIFGAMSAGIAVGGPLWLKTLIGVQDIDRATIEKYFMSSTSREVCELWDGERLNRVQHAGNIAIEEVIYLYGRGFETNRCLYTLDEAVERDFLVGQPAIRSLLKRMWLTWTGRWRTNSRSSLHYNIPPRSLTRRLTSSILPRTQPPYTRCDTSSEHEATNNGQRESPYSCPKACKSANLLGFTAPLAPNVILNTGIVLACPSILLGALLGIIVEAAVIIFLLVRSYIPWLFGLTQMAEESSRPLSAIGCILLSLGIFLICYIVDHSTQEIEYHINPERRKDISGFQVFWVQRGNQFEDQQYGSYLLLPQAKLDFILRSHPYEASGSNRTHVEHSDNIDPFAGEWCSRRTELIVVGASLSVLTGFGLLAAGLCIADHFSVSLIFQLGTVTACLIRGSVRWRLALANIPIVSVLPSDFELDKIALNFARCGDPERFWQECEEQLVHQKLLPIGTPSHVARMLACKFRFSDYTVPMPKMTFEVGLTGAHSNAGAGTGVKDVGEQRPVVYAGNVLCRGAADITPSEGVIARAMKIRSELGMVCNLHSPTQAVVLPLANAIVGAMEVLFPQGPSNVNNSAHGLSNAHPPEATKLWHNSSQESILDVTMSVETIFTAIPITLTQANAPTAADYYPLRLTYQHARGLWRIDLTQVEALLSLYMYSTRTHHVESECLERRFATKATSTFRPPSSVSDGDNLCLDLFGDSSSMIFTLRWWYSGSRAPLFNARDAPRAASRFAATHEPEALESSAGQLAKSPTLFPLCPDSTSSTFRIFRTNIITPRNATNSTLVKTEDATNDQQDPCENTVGSATKKALTELGAHCEEFSFREVNWSAAVPQGSSSEEYTLRPALIGSRMAYVSEPISYPTLPLAAGESQHADNRLQRPSDDGQWSIATLSPRPWELMCAQRVFLSFLNSALTQETFSFGPVAIESIGSSTRDENLCKYLQQELRLKNQRISKLVQRIMASKLYFCEDDASVRLLCALAQARKLPSSVSVLEALRQFPRKDGQQFEHHFQAYVWLFYEIEAASDINKEEIVDEELFDGTVEECIKLYQDLLSERHAVSQPEIQPQGNGFHAQCAARRLAHRKCRLASLLGLPCTEEYQSVAGNDYERFYTVVDNSVDPNQAAVQESLASSQRQFGSPLTEFILSRIRKISRPALFERSTTVNTLPDDEKA